MLAGGLKKYYPLLILIFKRKICILILFLTFRNFLEPDGFGLTIR